jgi:hypothetical protein
MRHFINLIALVLLNLTAAGQVNSCFNANDSAIKKTFDYWSGHCKTLRSSRAISKKQIKIDSSLISLANKIYNHILTLEEIKKLSKKFSNKRFTVSKKDSIESFDFRPYTEGNLRFYFEGKSVNNKLLSVKFSIGTNTKTGCENPQECCLQYFDFIYIRDNFLNQINFPLPLKSYLSDLVIEKLN